MNITTSDKKTIKKYVTIFFSTQALIALAIIAIVGVFGMKHMKSMNSFKSSVTDRLNHSTLD